MSGEVGFDEIYEWYCEPRLRPELDKTGIIRDTARIMYTMGMLDALGIFKGVRSYRGVINRTKKFRARLETDLADAERVGRKPLFPTDLVGKRVHITFKKETDNNATDQ